MSEAGTIIVRKSKKGKLIYEVKIEGVKKPMAIPRDFEMLDESFDRKSCQVVRDKGLITKIFIDGKELARRGLQAFPEKQKSFHKKGVRSKRDRRRTDFWNDRDLKLPADSRKALIEINNVSNFSLLLNRFIPWRYNNRKLTQFNEFLPTVESVAGNLFKTLSSSFNNRRKAFLDEAREKYAIVTFEAKLDWRMVVGLGAENVHETSMTLHHVYGIPYIPGSALKGISKNAAVAELCADVENEEPDVMDALLSMPNISKIADEDRQKQIRKAGTVRRQDGKRIEPKRLTVDKILSQKWKGYKVARKIFGSKTEAGSVIFWDAFPERSPNVKLDVMNPHYSDYYSKCEAPADWQNPKPINFLTVENSIFAFCLAAKKEDQKLLAQAERWIKLALESSGVGAKSSVGYGYFQDASRSVKQP